MSSDLRIRLEDAVGTPDPRPVDTAALWQRGRRQRRAKQATPVLAVLAVVGLGLGAVVAASDAPRDTGPAGVIEDGRDPGPAGWTPVAPGAVVTPGTVATATEDDVVVTATLLGHPATTFGGFDVREDGAVVTVLHDLDAGGIVVHPPGGSGWAVLGMPVPFLTDAAGYAIHSLQWGPDGRIYVTGMAPDATNRRAGLTQVAVLEADGTVVGVRENDAGQTHGLLFAGAHAWQRQVSEPGEERWQPVAEVGGRVLPMPEQRAGEEVGGVGPDGLVLTYEWDGGGPARFEGVAGDTAVTWAADDHIGIGVWDVPSAGRRVGSTVPTRPAGGVLSWLSDSVEEDGVLLSVLDDEGGVSAVHLPADVIGESWGLVNGTDAIIGRDGRLHWVAHTPAGPRILTYRHALP